MSEKPVIAPEFRDMDHFNAEINDVGYARYNSNELLEREREFTEMIPRAADVALFNSGAAAMHTALEAEGLKSGDIVFCADKIYGTTTEAVKAFQSFGVKVIFFDPSDSEKLEELVMKVRPRLIVAETVANKKEMPFLDVAKLAQIAQNANELYQKELTPEKMLQEILNKKRNGENISAVTRTLILEALAEFQIGNNPFVFRKAIRALEDERSMGRTETIRELSKWIKKLMIDSREKVSLILDNTLPSPVLLNPLENVQGYDGEIVVVESGTKHYQEGNNQITLGLAYSNDAGKIRRIKETRINIGTYLQPATEQLIPDTIHENMHDFLENHARNALHLARELEVIPGLVVYHPNLESHPQSDVVNELAPQGMVTLFYITLPEGQKGENFMQRVKEEGGNLIGLGSSFGHKKTWLSNYGMDERTVRIAAGSESEEEFQSVIDVFRKVAQE